MENREPGLRCILEDTGGAFTLGALGGSAFHFVKGLRNSPNGARIAGGLQAVRLNVPRLGGSFAVWGGVYSACDCALVSVRKKEDPWNSIISGAAAMGVLSVHQGLRAVVRSSVHGAVLLALISGAELAVQHNPEPSNTSVSVNSSVISPVEASSDDGSFSGLFGERKVEDGSAYRSSKTDTFGTSDMPSSKYK